ncbi:hypothetical protein EKD04_000240 [Chloroflexales bacterium ZM16-3]|nr:hypothetical protein [Chloroflexales bacterium ZM16-3]
MTLQEMLTEIPQLTTREQLVLLEVLSRSLNRAFTETSELPYVGNEITADRLYGAFNPVGKELSNEDIERIRFEAIMDKHQ